MNFEIVKRYLLGVLLIMCSPLTGMAQYNPDNPAEPGNPTPLLKYQVTTTVQGDDGGMVSGTGLYQVGTSVNIKATANTGYKFLYWTKNGSAEVYSTSASCVYTVEPAAVTFTAVFEKAKTVTVKINDSSAGTVSGSGSNFYNGSSTTISTTAKENYVFQYWLKDDDAEPYSTDMSFVYAVGDENVTFTAVYKYVKPIYDPASPNEPGDAAKNAKYRVSVVLSNDEAGVVSGSGKYKYGTTVNVRTSANQGYTFLKWLKNGTEYSTLQDFSYTVDTEDVTFTAVYSDYDGGSQEVNSHKLYLEANPIGSCTFNIANGMDVTVDGMYSVTATPGTDQQFEGWYIGGTLISKDLTYSATMGAEDVTLTAKCTYSPSDPDEPTGTVSTVELGDVNGDGLINLTDVKLLASYVVGKCRYIYTSAADMDSNGKIDIHDAVLLIDVCNR